MNFVDRIEETARLRDALSREKSSLVVVWKSHATLTLLATQDCPLWLQYD